MLDIVEERRKSSSSAVFTFLKTLASTPCPDPGEFTLVKTFAANGGNEPVEYRLTRPDDLVAMEHVTFAPFFNALGARIGLTVLSSILLERRVIFASSSLTQLSDSIHAALALLYPFEWQHVLIPILPKKLLDFCCSPTPFVVGILTDHIGQLDSMPMEEVVIINMDNGKFIRNDFNDDELIGWNLLDPVKHSIKTVFGKKADSKIQDKDAVVTSAVLKFMGEVMVTYRQCFQQVSGKTRFDTEEFIRSGRTKDVRKVLTFSPLRL